MWVTGCSHQEGDVHATICPEGRSTLHREPGEVVRWGNLDEGVR